MVLTLINTENSDASYQNPPPDVDRLTLLPLIPVNGRQELLDSVNTPNINVGMHQAFVGYSSELEVENDRDFFAAFLEAGKVYTINLTKGTLPQSMVTIDIFGHESGFNCVGFRTSL